MLNTSIYREGTERGNTLANWTAADRLESYERKRKSLEHGEDYLPRVIAGIAIKKRVQAHRSVWATVMRAAALVVAGGPYARPRRRPRVTVTDNVTPAIRAFADQLLETGARIAALKKAMKP